MAFDHHAHDALFPGGKLFRDFRNDAGLAFVVLAAVAVAGVDHQARRQSRPFQFGRCRGDSGCVMVGHGASAQHDMGLGIARGRGDRRAPVFVDGQEVMGVGRGQHGIDGDADIPVRAVLEPHRTGQPRGKLAVDLALGGARTDRAPGDEVDDVLGRHDVEELAGRGQAQCVDLQQQTTRQAQPLVDAEAVVETGIVDQALPAHRGAGFFEVDPHQDLEVPAMADALLGQAPGVVERGDGIVDRTGPDDDDEAVVALVEDATDRLAGAVHRVADGETRRRLADHLGRGRQGLHARDAQVVDGLQHVGSPWGLRGDRRRQQKSRQGPLAADRKGSVRVASRPNGFQPAPKASDRIRTKSGSGGR